MKLKKLSLVLSLLAFVALTSVGFAAWLITGDAEETLEGSIQVEEVIDRRVNAEVSVSGQEEGVAPTIVFGKPATLNAENPWLIPDSSAVAESLEFNITIVISKVDVLKANSSSFTVAGTVTEHEDNAAWDVSDPEVTVYEHLLTENLVGALPTIAPITFSKDAETQEWSHNTPTDYTITEDNAAKTITITIPVKFSWGTKYGIENPKNPFDYYNDGTKTAANDGDDALADLQALYKLNGHKYVATITISAE